VICHLYFFVLMCLLVLHCRAVRASPLGRCDISGADTMGQHQVTFVQTEFSSLPGPLHRDLY
jgi:hypothetical protein